MYVRKAIAEFSVEWLQVLDENGKVDSQLMPELSKEQIKEFYEWMVLTRTFDEIALKLQREGRLGTYAPMLGQEACVMGPALAMGEEDWMFPAFRESTAMARRGWPLSRLFQFWGGDERGMEVQAGVRVFPIAIPVGTQVPHAAGFALSRKLQRNKEAVLVFMGDGATSKGDFHEALNFAGVFKVPLVAVILNNQWAISVPRSRQTAAQTLAQKAISYGFQGVQVDGNDIFVVFKAVKEALARAKSGGGPTLIECMTYRIGDHTTADDAGRYRDPKEVEAWRKRDPIDRLEKYMRGQGVLDDKSKEKIWAAAKAKVNAAVKEAESQPPRSIEAIFSNTYAEMTPRLKEQLAQAKEEAK